MFRSTKSFISFFVFSFISEYWHVSEPNCSKYIVRFHQQTKIEDEHAYVRFYKNQSRSAVIGLDKYSGGCGLSPAKFPGLNEIPPIEILDSDFEIHFHCDAGSFLSSVWWGFSITIECFVLDKSSPQPSNSATATIAPTSAAATAGQSSPLVSPIGALELSSHDITADIVHYRLHCPNLRLRIRPTATLDLPEVGYCHDGDVVEVYSQMENGFYRLRNGQVGDCVIVYVCVCF